MADHHSQNSTRKVANKSGLLICTLHVKIVNALVAF